MFSRTYSRILRIKYYRNVTVFLPSIIQVLIFFCLVAESGVFGVRLDSLIERDRSFLEESPLETKVPLVFYKVSGIPGIKSKYYFSVFFLPDNNGPRRMAYISSGIQQNNMHNMIYISFIVSVFCKITTF